MNNNIIIINNIKDIYNTSPPDKIHELISKHFIPSQDEKKKNAEVPTPLVLVDSMLNKIPNDFWTKKYSVFEPCCGKGNFVMKIFEKFYNGLENKYPNKIKRCKTILQKCLYYADISNMNIFITTEILKCEVESRTGKKPTYKFNSYVGSTLDINISDIFNLDNFNAVIGNPPYNSSGDTATGNTIWQIFTKNALTIWLKYKGYLLFVHPPGWRKPNTDKGNFNGLFELMTLDNQMLYLEIHGLKDGKKIFKCDTRYDWYLIKCKPKYKNTIIYDELNNKLDIDLSEFKWLSNYNILEIKDIIAKQDDDKNIIIYSPSLYEHRKTWMSHNKDSIFKYPCVHSTPKTGVRYMYSKVNDKGHFGVPKVIFGEAGINDIVVDIKGEYGLTNGAIGIKIDDEETGKKISKALKTKQFHDIMQSCLYSSYRLDWNLFKEFKKDFWKNFIIIET